MKFPGKEISPGWLLLAWLLINLLQAAGTPLDPDETYYWMYASQLDWGYYDHPPAVAVLISIGKDWLPGALGLRFGHVLVSALTLLGLWHLLDKPTGKLLWLAAGLAFAQPFLNVYGFIATPDGPLLLFSVLYLLGYRGFLRDPSLKNGVIWGLTMAGALYSKYHGLMLIFFSVLPHVWWLVRQPGAWVAALGGAALYFPHLYWQYANDFPSFRYHLQGRNDPYRFKYTTEYVLNQLVIFSPLLIWHYGKALWKFRKNASDTPATARFLTANRWLIIGFLLFFLYSTTKGGTEAQWTALLSFPLVYLVFRAARDRFPEWQPRIWGLAVATIAILCLARVLLLAPRDWLPFQKPFDHQPWTERLAEKADGLPVMFENSYRLSSLYEFYTGEPGWTMTNVEYRRNQYDLWPGDSAFHNRPVLVAGQKNWSLPGTELFRASKSDMLLQRVEQFQVAKGIDLEAEAVPATLPIGGEVMVKVAAVLPENMGIPAVDFSAGLPLKLFATLHFENGEKAFYEVARPQVESLVAGNRALLFEGLLPLPDHLPSGPASLEWGLGYRGMPPLRGQSPAYPVVLE